MSRSNLDIYRESKDRMRGAKNLFMTTHEWKIARGLTEPKDHSWIWKTAMCLAAFIIAANMWRLLP